MVFAKKAETNTAHSAVHDKKSETAEDLPFKSKEFSNQLKLNIMAQNINY